MIGKPKFKPEITRIKLNPEQAVLACQCYSTRRYASQASTSRSGVCVLTPSKSATASYCRGAAGALNS